jgi:hypothetical protein
MTALMNPQHLRAGTDLEKAEQSVMRTNTRAAEPRDADPVELYTKELNDLAEELGIDFLDETGGGGGGAPPREEAPAPPTRNRPRAPPEPAHGGGARDPLRGKAIDRLLSGLTGSPARRGSPVDTGSDTSGSGSGTGSSEYETGSSEYGTGSSEYGTGSSEYGSGSSGTTSSGSAETGSSDSGSGSGSGDASILSKLGKELGISLDAARHRGHERTRLRDPKSRGSSSRRGGSARGRRGKERRHRHGSGSSTYRHRRYDSGTEKRRGRDGHRLGAEEERRTHIAEVMGDMRGETVTCDGMQHERSRDVQASKLEQIGQLRMTLEEEGVDCAGVGDPTMASSPEEVDSVLSILKLKNDRNRYSSLAEEVILGVAEGIETVLDGSRELPLVGWKPDYTGYHNTVLVKLHRMRFETSQVVGSVIEKHNVGPSARIVMELLPSFFLYPRANRKQRGSPGLASDPAAGGKGAGPKVSDARAAYGAIQASDRPNPLKSVSDI